MRRIRQGGVRWAVWKCFFLQGRRALERVVVSNWWRCKCGGRCWLIYWDRTWDGNWATCWSKSYRGFRERRMTLCRWRIGRELIRRLHWCKRCAGWRYKTTRRRTERFHAIMVDDQLFVRFYLTDFVSHFTDDLCDFVWRAPNRMKFRTESLGSWWIVEEYQLVFGMNGAMHFSIIKRMLMFRADTLGTDGPVLRPCGSGVVSQPVTCDNLYR